MTTLAEELQKAARIVRGIRRGHAISIPPDFESRLEQRAEHVRELSSNVEARRTAGLMGNPELVRMFDHLCGSLPPEPGPGKLRGP